MLSCKGCRGEIMAVVYKVKEVQVPGTFELDTSVGLSNIPNRRLVEARHTLHDLNLMLIGPAGSGKSTLLNALFCKVVLPEDRPRYPEGLDVCVMHDYSARLEEGGVKLDVTITEVVGYGEASGEAFKCLVERVCDRIRQPLHQQLELEYARLVAPKQFKAKFIHAAIFVIPPNSGGLSRKDIEFLNAIKNIAYVIPVFGKADSYTPEELHDRRNQIERTLSKFLPVLPGPADEYYEDVNELIQCRWPLATIASTKTLETASGAVRVRSYPWGNINVDDDAFNDLGLLQKILFGKLFEKLHIYATENIYEEYRSQTLMGMAKSVTPDNLKRDILAGRDNSSDTKMLSKIDIISRKAAERLRLSSSYEQLLQ